ncbi:MAG: hypothetical protein HRT66_00595 [Flavobacteriaceae bacterium]|nr:hypothetical protein [Flavobacteriaceae bacterium]
MIKKQIKNKYIDHYNVIENFTDNFYIADYTKQTKNSNNKRSVEFFSPDPPADIKCLTVLNKSNMSIDGIKFDNNSFVDADDKSKTQCETVCFPTESKSDSWVLFSELKYSSNTSNNRKNLKKAINQLKETRGYYIESSIINLDNRCYLIASLPLQSEPFANFIIEIPMLMRLKREENIILRMQNKVEIISDKIISI